MRPPLQQALSCKADTGESSRKPRKRSSEILNYPRTFLSLAGRRQSRRVPNLRIRNVDERRFAMLMMAPAALPRAVLVAYPVGLLVFNSFFKVDTITPHIRGLGRPAELFRCLDFETCRGKRAADRSVFGLRAVLRVYVWLLCGAAFFGACRSIAVASHDFALPLMVPPIVAGLLWRFLLVGNIGILNYGLVRLGLISDPEAIAWLSSEDIVIYSVAFADIWLTTSFVALVSYAGLKNIPKDLLEAARIDGANALKRFWHVTLPLMRPVIAVVVIVRGMDAAKTFDLIWIQTQGGPRHAF